MANAALWMGVALMVAIAAALIWEDWHFLKSGVVRANGKVFDRRKTTDDGADYYLARVRFLDADGRSVEFDDTYGKSTPQPIVGATVEVHYPKGAPKRARVRRPVLRLFIYLCVFGPLALLLAKAFGFISG